MLILINMIYYITIAFKAFKARFVSFFLHPQVSHVGVGNISGICKLLSVVLVFNSCGGRNIKLSNQNNA